MNINSAVSKNIKQIRESKKLTLDMAANITGVSRSMLAQIEKGDANPTISVLWKIASGYKVAFTSLVEAQDEGATLIRLDASEKIIEGDGKYINYPVFSFNEQRSFETYRIVILEGGKLEAAPHMSGTEEFITVFAGEVEITIQDDIFTLGTGDSLHFTADLPHSYKNVGNQSAELSMILYYTN